MRKKTLHDGHKKLWDDLAKSGSLNKKSSSVWEDTKYIHLIDKWIDYAACFCCQYNDSLNGCPNCPIEWTKSQNKRNSPPCLSESSPYHKWNRSVTAKTRKKYAAIIRDLQWREK